MANPAWRKIGSGPVPERQGIAWTALVQNVTPGKIIRIEVPRTGSPSDADAARASADQTEAQVAADAAAQNASQAAAELVAASKDLPVKETAQQKAAQKLATAKAAGQQAAQLQPLEQDAQNTTTQLTQAIGRLRTAADAADAADAAAARASAKLRENAARAADQYWTPKSAGRCTADGKFPAGTIDNQKLVVPGIPSGCLIARIGGGSLDMTADATGTIPRILFAVGRVCVFVVPDNLKGGPIFLAANDLPEHLNAVTGELRVEIYEAL